MNDDHLIPNNDPEIGRDLVERDGSEPVAQGNDLIVADLSARDLAPLGGGSNAVALVNEGLSYIAPAVDVAARCQAAEADRNRRASTQLVRYASPAQMLSHRREYHWTLLDDAHTAATCLQPIFCNEGPYSQNITPEFALSVLPVLGGVTNKKRDENTGTWLAGIIGMFDAAVDSVGAALGLWKSVPRHWAVLSLAIALLSRTQKFFPSQAELYDAMQIAYRRLGHKYGTLISWLAHSDDDDMYLFRHDRELWQAPYLASPEKIKTALQVSDFASHNIVNHCIHVERNIELVKLQRSSNYKENFVCDNCGVGYASVLFICKACFGKTDRGSYFGEHIRRVA